MSQTGVSVLEFVGLTFFFWDKTGAVYQAEHTRDNENSKGAGTRDALKSPVTWLCAAFFFAYMGVEGKCARQSVKQKKKLIVS